MADARGWISVIPFGSSSETGGDLSRLVLRDELDLECGGLFCAARGGSVGVPECELDLEVGAFFCEIRGNSVGVSE